jgi:chromosome segregation ATPase
MASSAGKRYTPEDKIALLESKLKEVQCQLEREKATASSWQHSYEQARMQYMDVMEQNRALQNQVQAIQTQLQDIQPKLE